MTSPALLCLSLDTDSISEAFITANTAAEAVIVAALEITSLFTHADQRGPARREWVRHDAACRPERVRVFLRRAEPQERFPLRQTPAAPRPAGVPDAAPILLTASPSPPS
jgi:hypothetical protein